MDKTGTLSTHQPGSPRALYTNPEQALYEDLQKAADAYDLGKLDSAELEKGGIVNYNFKTLTPKGTFNLRVFPEAPSPRRLKTKNLEYAVTDHLDKSNFHLRTPKFLSTPRGERYVVIDGKTFDVYERIPGETLDLRPGYQPEVIEAIAKYHRTMSDFSHDKAKPTQEYDGSNWLHQGLLEMSANLRSQVNPDKNIVESLPFIMDCYRALKLAGRPPQELVAAHGDINKGNLLYSEGKLAGIIDFGNVGWNPKTKDLTKLTRGDPEQLAKLVQHYRMHNNLSDEEVAHIFPERVLGLIHGIRWLQEDMTKAQDKKAHMLNKHLEQLRETMQLWDSQR